MGWQSEVAKNTYVLQQYGAGSARISWVVESSQGPNYITNLIDE